MTKPSIRSINFLPAIPLLFITPTPQRQQAWRRIRLKPPSPHSKQVTSLEDDLANPLNSPPDLLSALPVEIILRILKNLSPTVIALLRQQSRFLRLVIQENEPELAKEHIKLHTVRIKRHFDHLTNLAGLDLNECAARFTAYYGPAAYHCGGTLLDAVTRMGVRWGKAQAVPSGVLRQYLARFCNLYATRTEGARRQAFLILRAIAPDHGIQVTSDLLTVESPPLLETDTMHDNGVNDNVFSGHGFAASLDMQPLRRAPQLPDLRDLHFNYYTSSRRLQNMAIGATNSGKSISLLQQAALLESLYLF